MLWAQFNLCPSLNHAADSSGGTDVAGKTLTENPSSHLDKIEQMYAVGIPEMIAAKIARNTTPIYLELQF